MEEVEIVTHPNPIPGHPVPGMHIWGLVGPGELQWLAGEAAKMESIVEIGSMHGRSSFALATACPGKVICIDPWDESNRELYGDPPGDRYHAFYRNCGHFKNISAIRGRSPGAGVLVTFDPDMVWIDGAHDPESVLADIEYWAPRTLKLICGHDYGNKTCPGVRDAVDFYFAGQALTALPGEAIWYVRIQ